MCHRSPHSLPLLLATLLSLLILASCGGDDTTGPEPPPPAVTIDEATLGPDGGELSGDEIVLAIPAGALASDTDLAILEADEDHPYAPSELRTYRLTGLPRHLDAPLTLRLWHGDETADATAVCLAEERDSRSAGRGWVWTAAATRDSAGWSIATLTEGPYELADKADEDLQVAVIKEVRYMTSAGGHFIAGYPYPIMTDAEAQALLVSLEDAYQTVWDLGFHFGAQGGVWPKPVFCMMPEGALARYVSGQCGEGQFAVPPMAADAVGTLDRICTHEVLHYAQDYFDTRPCSLWHQPNAPRRWLDEATSSWLETRVVPPDLAAPASMNSDNYHTAFYGLLPGTEFADDLVDQNQYGYAMSSLIGYLVQHQGTGRVLELFQHFVATGSAAQAVMATADPPLDMWCADFHRHLYLQDIYAVPVGNLDAGFYEHLDLDGDAGDQADLTVEVADFGAQAVTIDIGGGDEDPADELVLHIEAGAELSVFLEEAFGETELYGVTTDSISVPDLDQILDNPDISIVALVSWPHGTPPEYDQWNEVALAAELRGEPDVEIDLTGFDTAVVHLTGRFTWDSGAVTDETITFEVGDGEYEGVSFDAGYDYFDDDWNQFWGNVHMAFRDWTPNIMLWRCGYGYNPNDEVGHFSFSLSGCGEVPLVQNSPTECVWMLTGAAVHDAIGDGDVDWMREIAYSTYEQVTDWEFDEDAVLRITLSDER